MRMTRYQLQPLRQLQPTMLRGWAGVLLVALLAPASAQDIRGIEACMSEKQIERRTGCLQANIEYLQQSLTKLSRDAQDKLAAAGRDLAAARAEMAELRSAIAKMSNELTQLKAKADTSGGNKKAEPTGSK